MKAFLWGVFLLSILAGIQLWPAEESKWIVIFPDTDQVDNAYVKVSGVKASIVEILDENTLVLKPQSLKVLDDLYDRGALIVVNAAGAYGCSSGKDRQWQRKIDG